MKICIVSDSHDRAEMLAVAVTAAQRAGAQAVIHCGDIIGANTLKKALEIGLPMHVVHGNNLGDPVALMKMAGESGGRLYYYGFEAELALCGRRIYVTHYPHIARGMACTGDFDLVCCGHSHESKIHQERAANGHSTWVVNPGTVAGVGGPATWAEGDLATMQFSLRSVTPPGPRT